MGNSVLSAGIVLSAVLNANESVTGKTNNIFPVQAAGEARLPYVVYYRTKLADIPVKTSHGADTAIIGVECCTDEYGPGVELAEAVREALDGRQARVATDAGVLTMRSCHLCDSRELWANDAYIQQLFFEIKI